MKQLPCPFEHLRDYPGCFEDCPDTDACPHTAAPCTRCGKEPAEVGGMCQMCWEAWCSEQWWATEGGMTCPLAVAADRRDQAQAKLERLLNTQVDNKRIRAKRQQLFPHGHANCHECEAFVTKLERERILNQMALERCDPDVMAYFEDYYWLPKSVWQALLNSEGIANGTPDSS